MLHLHGQVLERSILTLDGARNRTDMSVVEPVSIVQRSHPAFVLDLSNENLVHHLFHEGAIELGGVFKSEWDDAALFGWNAFHAFFNADGDFTCQDVAGTASRIDRHLQHLPGPPYCLPDLKRNGNAVTLDFTQVAHEQLSTCPDIYFGSPIEPLNWGMWLLHCIPSAVDYVASGHKGMFGCWFKLEWQHRLLNYLGIADDKLLQIDEWKTHTIKHLTFRSYPNIDLYVGERDREIFSTIARQCMRRSNAPRPSKIFVSRLTKSTPGAARRLANEAEFAAALEAIGFAVVEPELLPFEDQVAIFASATAIVGLGGAGMFNAVFSRAGTKLVTIEASNAFIQSHGNLFSSLGLSYAVVFGERDKFDDRWPHHGWTIDVARTMAQLREFI